MSPSPSLFFFFPLFSLFLCPQHAISCITYSELNDACSSQMPFSALISIHAVQIESYFDENAMLRCNAVGGLDFPWPEAIETWMTYLLS